ncbi:MAG TPA: trypsin-like peptidase domain-containing protein [Pyrinomonadaceae bacterium]|nr:trypsin-like peptidase domain-containing protein [Pyrinomonadaceae bacterium]
MAVGIIIHISVGAEKRTEFFSEERLSIGADDSCDLQIETKQVETGGRWLMLENSDGVFRVMEFDPELRFSINDKPIRRFIAISDGDMLRIDGTDISFSFFSLSEKPTLIRTNREQPHIAQFIEEAALESAITPQRDDAKVFLREFTRELLREVSWTSKLIALVLAIGFVTGVLYLGYAVNRELKVGREVAERQEGIIKRLEDQLGQTSDQLVQIEKSSQEVIKTVSLAQNVRVAYGNGVCLIIGVYDLVERGSGRQLRYADAQSYRVEPFEDAASEDAIRQPGAAFGLTTEGSGSPVEYDFIGTGFHVGGGYIVTNRHVLQPWTEDDVVKQMIASSNGRARIKKLVIYFPNYPQPFTLRVREFSTREDLAVATIDPATLPADVPVLPLENDSEASTIGKTVVTIGYPSGPDRLLAMVDDDEAKRWNERFGNSRQNLINFLAQSRKIVPLTTQGSITDLDTRRIVHDAKTAEGGSGAPLFGQTGKVIGVNFGVFTENTASNMAVPIRFVIDLLRRAGWKTADEMQQQNDQLAQGPSANTNSGPTIR